MPFVETSRTYSTATRLLEVQAPSALVVVAIAQGISSGINLATRDYQQIPMSRVSHHPVLRLILLYHPELYSCNGSSMRQCLCVGEGACPLRVNIKSTSSHGAHYGSTPCRRFVNESGCISVDSLQGSFDDTKGSLAVQQCATEQTRGELEEATQRTAHYLALGAAGALLTYLQQAKVTLHFPPISSFQYKSLQQEIILIPNNVE